MEALERGDMISSGLFYHGETDPVHPKETDLPGAHALAFQDVEAPVLVRGFILLLEVQEYLV